MPRNVGRVRHAHHMMSTTTANIKAPKPRNIAARVTSVVVKTSVLSTDWNQSQSV